VLVLLVANLVEDEELGLGTEVGDVTDAALFEKRLGLARDVARVARIPSFEIGSTMLPITLNVGSP
jgi:hypothetical protein